MGLLPMDLDILPPSDDRVFKLILTSPDAKPVLMDLRSCIHKGGNSGKIKIWKKKYESRTRAT